MHTLPENPKTFSHVTLASQNLSEIRSSALSNYDLPLVNINTYHSINPTCSFNHPINVKFCTPLVLSSTNQCWAWWRKCSDQPISIRYCEKNGINTFFWLFSSFFCISWLLTHFSLIIFLYSIFHPMLVFIIRCQLFSCFSPHPSLVTFLIACLCFWIACF